MSEIAISIEGLSKKYTIGRERSSSLREVFTNALNPSRIKEEDFWAIKDINIDIKKGDAVGIIGRNGAGKSTLLKILSQITFPTNGQITINGRVSSLLEVGTGFHPELTGRENIFLNGTLLGMSRQEIKSKYDEIVAFSGVEKFIHTAVKHYSSGMYVRLAFSVAAHLEPEVLIIDEVLAVGDAEFQKKCLGKMGQAVGEGRTVLFVSHNMNAVEHLCTSCILISNGSLEYHSNDVRAVIGKYLHGDESREDSVWYNTGDEHDNKYHTIREFGLFDGQNKPLDGAVPKNTQFFIKMKGKIIEENGLLNFGFGLYDDNNQVLFYSYIKDASEVNWPSLKKGNFSLYAQLPSNLFNEGKYRLEMVSGLHFKKWLIKPNSAGPSVYFEIQGGLSNSPYWIHKREGVIAPIIEWKAE